MNFIIKIIRRKKLLSLLMCKNKNYYIKHGFTVIDNNKFEINKDKNLVSLVYGKIDRNKYYKFLL